MAKEVIFDASVEIDGVDLSDHMRSVTITREAEEIDVTSMGSHAKERRQGLRGDQFEFEVFQDTAASSVDDVLEPLFDSGDAFFVNVIKDGTLPVSDTNPAWHGQCVLLSYSPLAVEVGQASMTTIVCPTYEGKIFRYTSGTYS
jgi:hypothetical protein